MGPPAAAAAVGDDERVGLRIAAGAALRRWLDRGAPTAPPHRASTTPNAMGRIAPARPAIPRPSSPDHRPLARCPRRAARERCRSILHDHPAMSSHPEGLRAPPPSPAQDPTRTPHHATWTMLVGRLAK